MPAGNAKPSGHLVPSPIMGLACAPIVETRSLELAMSLLDFSPRIPLGIFSILLSAPISQNFTQKWERMLNCLASFSIYKNYIKRLLLRCKCLIGTYHFHYDQCLGRTCARASNLARFLSFAATSHVTQKSRDCIKNVKLTFLISVQNDNRM